MDEENDLNRRKELLDSFRDSLSKPLSERFFDEDALIEIFDYAGDIGDDYLRLEALMCGARFYPDSQELKERHAIFYSQRSPESLDRYLEDNPESIGMIWDIMRVSTRQPRGEEAVRSLDYLLRTYDNFTDEETIQLVNLAHDLYCYDWLTANFPRLREKTGYLPVLIYETSVIAELNRDTDTAVKLMEEITEIDPFNAYYWQRLAMLSSADPDKALPAIEYSLAIEPDNVQALLVKANLLFAKEQYTPELQELATDILHRNPDDVDVAKFYAMICTEAGNLPEARKTLQDLLDRHPEYAPRIVPDLLGFQPDNIDELLDMLYEMSDDHSEMLWSAWMDQASNNGFHDVASRMYDCFARNAGVKLSIRPKIENLFINGRYAEVIETIEHNIEEGNGAGYDYPVIMTLHLVSLIKTGEFENARKLCKLISDIDENLEFYTARASLDMLALREVFRQASDLVNDGDPTPEQVQAFNPVTFATRNSKDKK